MLEGQGIDALTEALATLGLIRTFSSSPEDRAKAVETARRLLAANPAGPKTTIKVVNLNKGSVVLSLYLYKTKFGECGYRGYNLGALDSILITDLPQGCYFAGAFINTAKKQSKAFGDGMCMNNDDKWTMNIGPEVISLTPP